MRTFVQVDHFWSSIRTKLLIHPPVDSWNAQPSVIAGLILRGKTTGSAGHANCLLLRKCDRHTGRSGGVIGSSCVRGSDSVGPGGQAGGRVTCLPAGIDRYGRQQRAAIVERDRTVRVGRTRARGRNRSLECETSSSLRIPTGGGQGYVDRRRRYREGLSLGCCGGVIGLLRIGQNDSMRADVRRGEGELSIAIAQRHGYRRTAVIGVGNRTQRRSCV